MAVYKLYHRKDERFFHFDEIEAADDTEAERRAEGLRGSMASELWTGRRCIAVYAAVPAEAEEPVGRIG
jgi:hypothetical protein